MDYRQETSSALYMYLRCKALVLIKKSFKNFFLFILRHNSFQKNMPSPFDTLSSIGGIAPLDDSTILASVGALLNQFDGDNSCHKDKLF